MTIIHHCPVLAMIRRGGDCQEPLKLDAPFGYGLLVNSNPDVLAAHHPSLDLGLCSYSRVDDMGFPEPP